MDRLLWYVFAGSRGGATRTRIMTLLLHEPLNTNQLAERLGMDYKTIEYNLRVLRKHVYAAPAGEGYGVPWGPSKNLLASQGEFDAIASKLMDGAESGKQPNTAEEE